MILRRELLVLALIFTAPNLAFATDIVAVVRSALANNPEVAGKGSEVLAAQEDASGARAERLPMLSSELGVDAAGNSSSTVVARQVLFSFDRVNRSIKRADTEVARQQAELMQVQRKMAERAALAFLDVLQAKRRTAEVQAFVSEMEDLTAGLDRRVQAGLASEADLRLGEIRVAEAKSRMMSAQTDEMRAMALLDSVAFMDVKELDAIDPAVLKIPEPKALLKLALDKSAELQAKRAGLDSAAAALALEKRAGMPSLYGEVRKDLATAEEPRIGVFLQYQVDGLGKTQAAKVRSSAARLGAANSDLEATDRRIRFDVEQLLTQIDVQTAMIALQDDMLSAVDGAVESNERLFTAGKVQWSEVLNIYRERHEKRLESIGLDRELTAARLQLAVMVGRLDPSK